MASSVAIYLPLQTGPSALRTYLPFATMLALCSGIFLSCCAASLYMSQAPSGLQTQQVLYVPVTILMMPSINCFPSIYLFNSSSNWAICPLSCSFFCSPCCLPVHVTSTKQVTNTANTLCACNCNYDAKHHLFSKYLPFQQLLFQLGYLPSQRTFCSAACCLPVHVTSTKQVTNTANTLCACNHTYDAKHHLFSKDLPAQQINQIIVPLF